MSETVKIAELRSRLDEALNEQNIDEEAKIIELFEKCRTKIKELWTGLSQNLRNKFNQMMVWLRKRSNVTENVITDTIKSAVKAFRMLAEFIYKCVICVIDVFAGTVIYTGLTVVIAKLAAFTGLYSISLGFLEFLAGFFGAITGISFPVRSLVILVMLWFAFTDTDNSKRSWDETDKARSSPGVEPGQTGKTIFPRSIF